MAYKFLWQGRLPSCCLGNVVFECSVEEKCLPESCVMGQEYYNSIKTMFSNTAINIFKI
jgi:hypothetical protein